MIREHQHRFKAKFAVAKVEKIFKTGSQQVYHHDIVLPLYAIPAQVGDASCRGTTTKAPPVSTTTNDSSGQHQWRAKNPAAARPPLTRAQER